MGQSFEIKLITGFTLFYTLFFAILALIKKNYEFLYYVLIITAIILIVSFIHKKIHLPLSIITGLSILGILHMLGGFVMVGEIRLYDFWIIPKIYKYDHFIHMSAIFIVTLISYSLLHPHLDKTIRHNRFLLSSILVLLALGVGVLNEIIELIAVIFFDGAKGVGDYYNNAWDLVFNLFGSIIGCLIIMRYHIKLERKKINSLKNH